MYTYTYVHKYVYIYIYIYVYIYIPVFFPIYCYNARCLWGGYTAIIIFIIDFVFNVLICDNVFIFMYMYLYVQMYVHRKFTYIYNHMKCIHSYISICTWCICVAIHICPRSRLGYDTRIDRCSYRSYRYSGTYIHVYINIYIYIYIFIHKHIYMYIHVYKYYQSPVGVWR
jgi:hypothetical protein